MRLCASLHERCSAEIITTARPTISAFTTATTTTTAATVTTITPPPTVTNSTTTTTATTTTVTAAAAFFVYCFSIRSPSPLQEEDTFTVVVHTMGQQGEA